MESIIPKTKIICTIGPTSETPETIRTLINSGMSVARLNFSHGTHPEHLEKIRIIRQLSSECGKHVAILQDLCGPKIRIGEIEGNGIRLIAGEKLILTSDQIPATGNRISISYPDLPREVKPKNRLLLSDGLIELVVEKTTLTEIFCRVIIGGILTSHKGINLLDGTIKAPAMTSKDKADLLFGIENNVDYVAVSFVRNAKDISNVKKVMHASKKYIPIIAKIEKHEAVSNIDEIIDAADALMVARGDLGVEIPLESVPNIQKMMIKRANSAGKPVIVATQMLRSMIDSPRPTRAEVTDVANAVLDGADAVMLSEETAIGQYPVAAVQVMSRIIVEAESVYPHEKYLEFRPGKSIPESVSHAACILAEHLDASAIVAPTRSGFTAMKLSRFRPRRELLALSPSIETVRRLALCWGCRPALMTESQDTDEMIDTVAQAALDTRYVSPGDIIIITSGHPLWVPGTTKMIRVKEL
jgi:pyruvate kinase